MNRDITVSRDASALTGSVSVDLAYPTAAVNLPSNLVDTTDLETFTQELRLATETDGPFNFVAGVFYAHTARFYRQRLPTPGYDAFTDARFGAGTSVAVANVFPLNSPYNSDLPYSINRSDTVEWQSPQKTQFKVEWAILRVAELVIAHC